MIEPFQAMCCPACNTVYGEHDDTGGYCILCDHGREERALEPVKVIPMPHVHPDQEALDV